MTETIQFPIEGMTCSSCVNRITRSLKKVDGVRHVRVNLARETATVERDPSGASDAAIAAAVVAAGYEPDIRALVVVTDQPSKSGWLSRLIRH